MSTDVEWHGPFRFAAWPVAEVPAAAAGVYTIWDNDTLVYVGMSGRGRTADQLSEEKTTGRRVGLWTRLNSHASGRRSGDQFCVYVADRLVLPMLTAGDIELIAAGALRLDDLVRAHIRERMSFRFTETVDGESAMHLETRLRSGDLGAKPLLNPH